MKDIENVAVMLLFIENGERSLSQADIDKAFAEREEEWPDQDETIDQYTAAINFISNVLHQNGANAITVSRLRNQADFYSLFGAVVELQREGRCPTPVEAAASLIYWVNLLRQVEREDVPAVEQPILMRYLGAARAASNDAGPRRVRIDILKDVLSEL